MRRIKATLSAIFSIIVLLFIIRQALDMGAPWMFMAVGIFMIFLILVYVIRGWLRGY